MHNKKANGVRGLKKDDFTGKPESELFMKSRGGGVKLSGVSRLRSGEI